MGALSVSQVGFEGSEMLSWTGGHQLHVVSALGMENEAITYPHSFLSPRTGEKGLPRALNGRKSNIIYMPSSCRGTRHALCNHRLNCNHAFQQNGPNVGKKRGNERAGVRARIPKGDQRTHMVGRPTAPRSQADGEREGGLSGDQGSWTAPALTEGAQRG